MYYRPNNNNNKPKQPHNRDTVNHSDNDHNHEHISATNHDNDPPLKTYDVVSHRPCGREDGDGVRSP